jgi:protein SCO1/2
MSATHGAPSDAQRPDERPPDGASPPSAGGNSIWRWLLGAVVAAAVAVGVVVAVSGGKSSGARRFDGLEARPPTPEFALSLRNYTGQRIDLNQYRGRAVLVTFLYTHCPDVCPLITANLRVAQNLMGPKVSKEVQVVAVSVDPRGDTRSAIEGFLAKHEMTGRMQYLVGSLHELGQVWKRWGIGSEKDAKNPEFIDHSAEIYGISASGRITTLYASNFRPAQIAHDVPLLASE